MLKSRSFPFDPRRWFIIFFIFHLLAWTFVPWLVRCNLPLDSIEGATWGHQLEWGYDKNPFMNGWLTALATVLDHRSGLLIYFFSQLSIVSAFWVVWQLGKKILSPVYALVAVLLLEVIQYYNFHSIDFNDNTLEIGLWALTTYFFYQALQTKNRYRHWILTGVFAALGMMAKYYTGVLLTVMLLFMLFNANGRKQFKSPALYLGALIFILICLPHLFWLTQHQFITVEYVFERAAGAPRWTNHFFFPAQFMWQQFEVLLPCLIFFSLMLIGKRPIFVSKKISLSAFNKRFLLFIGIGPFLITLLLSLALSVKLRAGWGAPLMTLWTLLLLAWLQPVFTNAKLYRAIAMTFTIMILFLGSYTISLLYSKDTSTANFPGREIATYITNEWHAKYHTPLKYVAGSRWVAGNIEYYSPDHPAVFIEWNPSISPWINDADLRKQGGVFVWEASRNELLPLDIKRQYPNLKNFTILEFDYKHNVYDLEPVRIGVAFLPPEK